MASGLYDELPRFRAVVDECSEHLAGQLGIDLRTLLLDTTDDASLETILRRTRLAQPALFVTEYALASQLLDWGMRPTVLIGHSLGEYTAACVAQALSLPDALDLVAVRGRLMDGAPPGAMLAVHAAGDKVEPLLPEGVSIAACNAPEAVVVSGPCEAVEQFAETAAKRGIFVRPLRVSHGFHSVLMDSVLDEFRDHASAVRYRRPRLRVMSNLTGEPVRAYSAEYWTRHLREPVGFSAGLARVLDMADPMLVEVGPGRTLTSFARSHERDAALPCQPMMPGTEGTDPYTALLAAVGALWTAGTEVDWTAFSGGQGRRIVLPPYPFQRRRHWVERSAPARAEPLPASKSATEPVAQQQEPMREGQEPATVESRLQAIWKQLLGDQPISDDADFFGLGGDSLLAVRLLSLIRREFGVTLNLDTVLEHPVLAAQVALVRERSTESFTPANGHAGEDTIAP